MKAVIMAGGQGTRLRSVSGDLPKPMVPVLGKAVLAYQIECLRQNGIEEIFLIIGYRGEAIREYFGDGSSFGVTKVKSPEEFLPAVDYAFAEGKTVIAEKFISGREIDDAVYFDGKQVIALPPVQIVPQKEYFDFEAKYEGWSKEICPAPITEAEDRMIRECSVRIYERFGCRGFVRVDYFLTDSGELFFLEMNTVPGMTAESLVPKEIRAAGMDVRDFLSVIIETTFDGGRRH